MLDTLKASITILKLEYPVRFTVRTKAYRKPRAGDSNIVVGKKGIRYHQINLYLPDIESSGFTLQGILAHELIHAWQFENIHGFLQNDTIAHGEIFAEKARYLEKMLWFDYSISIPMRDLYNPETDTP